MLWCPPEKSKLKNRICTGFASQNAAHFAFEKPPLSSVQLLSNEEHHLYSYRARAYCCIAPCTHAAVYAAVTRRPR